MFYRSLWRRRFNNFSPVFAYRMATAISRALPDFLIVGCQKCGTTSLFSYLAQHPQVEEAIKKEIKYFDMFYGLGPYWYRSHFPRNKVMHRTQLAPLTGEATPDYIFFEECAERVSKLVPQVKLIVLLREPAERSFSQYRYSFRRGFETLSFVDAIAAEEARLSEARREAEAQQTSITASVKYREFSYVKRSQYVEQIKAWQKYFSREQFLFLSSEEMDQSPEQTLSRILSFLDLPTYSFTFSTRLNSAPSKPDCDAQHEIDALRRQFVSWQVELAEMTGVSFEGY